jgi:hypothetical protein
MAAELCTLTHEIPIQLHLLAESCTMCSSLSRRSVQKFWIHPLTLTFGITRCCPVPSLCNVSSVSAIAGSTGGNGFLESRVGRSAIVPEFH